MQHCLALIKSGKVVVAFDGPPFVISQIISNILKELEIPQRKNEYGQIYH